ncbi:MAG TPA: RsmF rRNA methyltransferase first C-terminal domain-containing protein [Candidatus Caccousia avistercoris]|nr:RsmF rRNA methyltransferase first C-terminal domain-containing protein [Candidatus Caccousia avistercoris]
MAELPAAFLTRMKELLGEEYGDFLAAYEKPPLRGIRLNPLKCTEEKLRAAFPFPLKPAPFSPLSFCFPQEGGRVGTMPLHHAGAFYSQEPSAASAVTVLAPQPGDRVLDLCAAPGGKSTQIAALLQGKGLLWSNEVVKSRANVLLSNLERLGVRNGVVSSCRPEVLCPALAGFFDKVLVDAPCSGEGMFRRDPQAVAEWSPEHVRSCAARQAAILDSAAQALRPGGLLAYSTCTFSLEENEETVTAFLERHPEFSLCEAGLPQGRPGLLGMNQARRIYPMDGGEGHFAALLKKAGGPEERLPYPAFAEKEPAPALRREAEALWQEIFSCPMPQGLCQAGEQLLLLPEGLPPWKGLGVLRAGVLFAAGKGKRWEPCHALFMAASPGQLRRRLDFPAGSPEISAFLRGEELPAPEEWRGWTGVSVDGVMLGFGKCSQGRLKNRYPKGLRNF